MSDLAVVRSAVAPLLLPVMRAEDEEKPEPVEGEEAKTDEAERSDSLGTLTVDFSPFDHWYEINSYWEGEFLERTTKGAFAKTISERLARIKVMFNHGHDLSIGEKLLGPIESLEELDAGPHAEVSLLDTSYNRDLLPALKANLYGSSFMFNVLRDEWNEEPGVSDWNPRGIPERTITEVRLLEFGPVTWPANPDATSGARSLGMTDRYARALRAKHPKRADDLAERFADFRAQHGLRTPESDAVRSTDTSDEGAATTTTDAPDTVHPSGLTPSQRAARLRELANPFLKETVQ